MPPRRGPQKVDAFVVGNKLVAKMLRCSQREPVRAFGRAERSKHHIRRTQEKHTSACCCLGLVVVTMGEKGIEPLAIDWLPPGFVLQRLKGVTESVVGDFLVLKLSPNLLE